MTRTAVSVRLVADAPVALVDHARAERRGLDQVQRDVFGDRRQEPRAATDDDRISEHAQIVDEAEPSTETLIEQISMASSSSHRSDGR